jgi:hypothetical protein
MRLARLEDYKRRVRTKSSEWQLKLQRFAFSDVPSLGTAEIALTSPFLILSGPNGVGKTTVLRAIWATADPKTARPAPGASLKLTTGSATLDYSWEDARSSSAVSFAAGKIIGGVELPTTVVHLDASADPLRYQRHFCQFESLDDIINGVGGSALDPRTLVEVNYICKRDYREIVVYEVEDGEAITPFFEVQLGGDRYDSRTMGAGEISALHTWWTVNRAADNSLLLIEEPETFLSPASQQGIAHFLLASTVDKHLVTILTSHSAKIIDSVADDHRLYLYRDSAGAKFAEVPVSPRLLATIGIEPTIKAILLVEDQAAELFLRQLLVHFDPTFARSCEICDRQGDGNIITTLDQAAGKFRAVKIIGVFDGDMRGKVPSRVEAFAAYLPGNDAIEIIFRDLIMSNVEGAAEALSKPKLGEVLFSVEGADHHDWYAGLCEGLGLTRAQLFPMLFCLWLKQPTNEASAVAALNFIRTALDGRKTAASI